MQFHNPYALLLLLLLPVLGYKMLRHSRSAGVRFSSLADMQSCPTAWRVRLRPVLAVLRLLCLALLIIALARPRKGTVLSEVSTKAVAIEAVVDRSGSMETEMDFFGQKLNRIEVVKRVLTEFIKANKKKGLPGRKSDIIGLVTFARYADTLCPLVLTHNILLEFLKKVDIVKIKSENATAIGDAIALAAARLRTAEQQIQKMNRQATSTLLLSTAERADDAQGDTQDGTQDDTQGGAAGKNAQDNKKKNKPGFEIKSKVIILLTDGRNNAGIYNPMQAAELAKKWGIKIYTIGIGSPENYGIIQTPMGPMKIPTGQELDEKLLKEIAKKTGGSYSRAEDAESLRAIIKEIDKKEKTKITAVQYTQYDEKFERAALPALLILLAEIIASCTVLRKIP